MLGEVFKNRGKHKMKTYLSMKVWSTSEVALTIFAAAVLLAVATVFQTAVFSLNGAIAGIFGGVVLRHFALHGWTLLHGNVAQRSVLFALWLIAVVIGGIAATLIGF